MSIVFKLKRNSNITLLWSKKTVVNYINITSERVGNLGTLVNYLKLTTVFNGCVGQGDQPEAN